MDGFTRADIDRHFRKAEPYEPCRECGECLEERIILDGGEVVHVRCLREAVRDCWTLPETDSLTAGACV